MKEMETPAMIPKQPALSFRVIVSRTHELAVACL